MRAVVQRVLSASVTGIFLFEHYFFFLPLKPSLLPVNSEVVSEISRGLMVLVGIGAGTRHSTYTFMKRESRLS
jgi:D-Tyr-tRNAtyr deacylase